MSDDTGAMPRSVIKKGRATDDGERGHQNAKMNELDASLIGAAPESVMAPHPPEPAATGVVSGQGDQDAQIAQLS